MSGRHPEPYLRAMPRRQRALKKLWPSRGGTTASTCLKRPRSIREPLMPCENSMLPGTNSAWSRINPAVHRRHSSGFGLDGYFTLVLGGDSGLPLKPDPTALFSVLERCGVQPSLQSWIVGDHYADLEAGRRAGFPLLLLLRLRRPPGRAYELAVNSLERLSPM